MYTMRGYVHMDQPYLTRRRRIVTGPHSQEFATMTSVRVAVSNEETARGCFNGTFRLHMLG